MDIKKLLDKYQIRPQVKKEDTENTVLDREIDKLVPGKVVNNEHGSYFMTENRYPLTYLYGGVPLGDLLDIDDVSFECLAGNPYLDRYGQKRNRQGHYPLTVDANLRRLIEIKI
jgi:hypothetical protein